MNIRNFAIIAHIDHGKSTLADRLLEVTGTVEKRHLRAQFLDSNPIERERGITIKLAPVRMVYQATNPKSQIPTNSEFILNLIDTPGHVDFAYEVERSLAAGEGAVLLIDATQGVQAQTLAHYNLAHKLGLAVIPVINKIDVAGVNIELVKLQISEALGLDPDTILSVSAKTGQGVPELLRAIIDRIPPPKSQINKSTDLPFTRALVFNSNFDPHQGVIAWVRVFDGEIKTNDKIILLATQTQAVASVVGVFTPGKKEMASLSAGEVGYVITNLKDVSLLTIGDTITVSNSLSLPAPRSLGEVESQISISALPGYRPIRPVVFVSLYPLSGSQIKLLGDALGKLKLMDSSISFTPEISPALGSGYRIGLLGLLHADIIQERLEREFGLELIATAPGVEFEVNKKSGETVLISAAKDLPDPSEIERINEPFISLTLFLPQNYLGPVIELLQAHRGEMQDLKYIGSQVQLLYLMPFVELIRGFYDDLKSITSGFATFDYEQTGFKTQDLVKLDILIAGDKVDVLSQIIPREKAPIMARELVGKLKEIIPRQQFEISIQAAIGGKILARADLKSFRKDVTAKLYGGDQTRKDKLLKKQKKGKLRMKQIGKIDIPQEALLSILKV